MKKILTKFILMISIIFEIQAIEIKTIDKVSKDYQEAAYSFMSHSYISDEDLKKIDKLKFQEIPSIFKPDSVLIYKADENIDIPLYIYRPQKSKDKLLPVIYYSHGGGFLLRLALNHYQIYQNLADTHNVAVVVPKYRLSTEAPFPAALNDVYTGLLYIKKEGKNLNLDSDKIILMGDSAGGGLSTSVALYNRDNANIKILGQVLVYPMLDSRTGSESSLYHAPFAGEITWNKETNKFAWKNLKGNKEISNEMIPYFSPAQAQNFSNLPPTLIYVGDLDLFANENLIYASKLIEAGVPTELHLIRGLYHSFDLANPEAQQTKEFWNKIHENINYMLNNSYK
ncbi:alpha/beta hydrolase [uncultured Fusobacterium sp.]|uniref:alpha/beta hydrolase n=1 Tax=uncultured Fusobacterium sp. TaxID=159267 RepID=UPI0027DBDC13|nr:alpha/beta hydrolase [uncultured Fusobacterium sp.]